jgi:murein DD-endopeptidase MepM/ murein hydrolase activator NlpD
MRLVLPCPEDSFWISQRWGENEPIYRRFGYPGHNGIDFAISVGTPILATGAGRVTVVGWDAEGYGQWIEIAHEFGGRTRYAHGTPQSAQVQVGEDVAAGQHIMDGDTSGFSTGPHLHYEIRFSDSVEAMGVDYFPTRWGSFCIDPGPFMPEPYGEGLDIGDDNVDERVSKLEAELRQERARADTNYNKFIKSGSSLGWTIRALNRAGDGVLPEDRERLAAENAEWAGKI